MISSISNCYELRFLQKQQHVMNWNCALVDAHNFLKRRILRQTNFFGGFFFNPILTQKLAW